MYAPEEALVIGDVFAQKHIVGPGGCPEGSLACGGEVLLAEIGCGDKRQGHTVRAGHV